jgi:dihydrofolate reductase
MKAIVAMDLNRVIGYQGRIPWKISEDLKFFKRMTSDKINGGFLLMGRKTFESVRTLPDRFIYVLTNNEEKRRGGNFTTHRYLNEEDFQRVMNPSDRIWVCGGAEIYEKYIPLCSEVYVTILTKEYEGDTYLHYFEDDFPKQELLLECSTHWIVKYSKLSENKN